MTAPEKTSGIAASLAKDKHGLIIDFINLLTYIWIV
ncbi:hypothetical protein BXY39_1000 [Eilatimonas milleporae]|uniref:Uncharacterized protein n=1 Tax=Eilatimonas milleporae TaxID=911205 RepID=A0A3M0CSI4_9PROT|nr:hypothetical protein BXY39_1000 [Eilatimonas milleporae]